MELLDLWVWVELWELLEETYLQWGLIRQVLVFIVVVM